MQIEHIFHDHQSTIGKKEKYFPPHTAIFSNFNEILCTFQFFGVHEVERNKKIRTVLGNWKFVPPSVAFRNLIRFGIFRPKSRVFCIGSLRGLSGKFQFPISVQFF